MKVKVIKTGSEAEIQAAVKNYLDAKGYLYCASAGGVKTSFTQAVRMKRTGYKKGFPDLFIYEPRGNYHGLAIELKREGQYPTIDQKTWITELDKRGYKAFICKGIDEALKVIDDYFS